MRFEEWSNNVVMRRDYDTDSDKELVEAQSISTSQTVINHSLNRYYHT